MYKLNAPIGPESLTLNKGKLWDLMYFDWKDMTLTFDGQIMSLPKSISIPVKDKLRVRRIFVDEDLDLQFMIKQGTNWYSLHYRQVLSH